jgi:hypothetical protein
MGQAKQRGNKQEREAQAKAKVQSLKPATIECNFCKEAITDVNVMDTRGMQGIDGAFAGMCACGHTTWALAGNPEAVADFAVSLEATMGHEAIIGSIPYPAK